MASKIIYILLILTATGNECWASPLFGIDLPFIDLPSLPSPSGVINSLKNIVSNVLSGIRNSLALAGDGIVNGRFLENLKLDIQNKIEAGGKVTEMLLRQATAHTLDLAVGNKIIDSHTAGRIVLTFKMGTPAAAEILTKVAINDLRFAGDEEAADQFRSDLTVILKAQDDNEPASKVFAGLLHALIDLLTGNAIIKAKGALELKNYFNVQNLISGFKGALGSKINSIIQDTVATVRSFMTTLKAELQEKIDAVAFMEYARIVGRTLNSANTKDILGGDTVKRLKVTFGGAWFGSPLEKPADVDTLIINGDPASVEKYRKTLKTLLQMKTDGYSNAAILGGLESATIDLLKENNAIKKGLLRMTEGLMLNAVVDLLTDASALTAHLQTQIHGNKTAAERFVTKLKPALQEKVAASGSLTTETMNKVISGALNLGTGNKIFNLEAAARLAISFGINIGLDVPPVQPSELNSFVIAGDPKAAGKFRDTISSLLKITAKGDASVSTLGGVVDALMGLLVSNAVIESTAADELTKYFSA